MTESAVKIHNPTLKHYILMFPVFAAVRLLQWTVRLVADEKSREYMSSPKRLVGVAWHSRIFFLSMCKYYYRDNFPMSGLVSASRDGAYLCAFFKMMKIGAVRGSHRKRGANAIIEMVDAIRSGSDIFITPDGPLGPKNRAKAGFTLVAKESGTRILALRITPRHYWKIGTWDGFMIPKPFSKIDVLAREYESFDALKAQAQAAGVAPEKLVENFLNSAGAE